jgi:hypothetical protein
LERQYIIFGAAAAAVFGALVLLWAFNVTPTGASEAEDENVIEAQIGKRVYVRYSSAIIDLINKLPSKNHLVLMSSSELHNTNLAGLNGEVRFGDVSLSYTQNGKVRNETAETFSSIEFRFLPDPGTNSTYTYENVKYDAETEDSQLIATFVPLSTAKVGEKYAVKLVLDGGVVDYAVSDKVIKIVG